MCRAFGFSIYTICLSIYLSIYIYGPHLNKDKIRLSYLNKCERTLARCLALNFLLLGRGRACEHGGQRHAAWEQQTDRAEEIQPSETQPMTKKLPSPPEHKG